MALEQVVQLVKSAVSNTGFLSALQNDPAQMRQSLQLSDAHLRALISAGAFSTDKQTVTTSQPELAFVAEGAPTNLGTLLPPEGTGELPEPGELPPAPESPMPQPPAPQSPMSANPSSKDGTTPDRVPSVPSVQPGGKVPSVSSVPTRQPGVKTGPAVSTPKGGVPNVIVSPNGKQPKGGGPSEAYYPSITPVYSPFKSTPSPQSKVYQKSDLTPGIGLGGSGAAGTLSSATGRSDCCCPCTVALIAITAQVSSVAQTALTSITAIAGST